MLYLSHDSDASEDPRLLDIQEKYGMLGYGVYWFCNERICKFFEIPKNTECRLEDDIPRLAKRLNITEALLVEILDYFVQVGAFKGSRETGYLNLKILHRMCRYSYQKLKSYGVTVNKDTPVEVIWDILQEIRIHGKVVGDYSEYNISQKSTQKPSHTSTHTSTPISVHKSVQSLQKNVSRREEIRQDNKRLEVSITREEV